MYCWICRYNHSDHFLLQFFCIQISTLLFSWFYRLFQKMVQNLQMKKFYWYKKQIQHPSQIHLHNSWMLQQSYWHVLSHQERHNRMNQIAFCVILQNSLFCVEFRLFPLETAFQGVISLLPFPIFWLILRDEGQIQRRKRVPQIVEILTTFLQKFLYPL